MLALNKIQPGVNGLAVIEREVREPGPGEMLVRVHAAGVCGTDMQLYQGAGFRAAPEAAHHAGACKMGRKF